MKFIESSCNKALRVLYRIQFVNLAGFLFNILCWNQFGLLKGLFKHRMSMEWLSGIPIIFSEVGCSVLVQESISSSDRLRVVKKLLTSLWLKLQLI